MWGLSLMHVGSAYTAYTHTRAHPAQEAFFLLLFQTLCAIVVVVVVRVCYSPSFSCVFLLFRIVVVVVVVVRG